MLKNDTYDLQLRLATESRKVFARKVAREIKNKSYAPQMKIGGIATIRPLIRDSVSTSIHYTGYNGITRRRLGRRGTLGRVKSTSAVRDRV